MKVRTFLIAAVVVLCSVSGCAIKSWDAEATDGYQFTHWGWGLEISYSLYIGPARGSYTEIQNSFEVQAEGIGDDDKEPEETEEKPIEPNGPGPA